MNSDTMTPPRIAKTASAAARVRSRKMRSPKRNRSRAFARDAAALSTAASDCNATSTTGCLRFRLGLSWHHPPWRKPWRATTRPLPVQNQAPPPEPREGLGSMRSVPRREDRLALLVLDLGPALLDRRDDVGGQRHEVELLGHLAAFGVGPGKELERLGRVGRPLGFLVHQDE